MTVTNAELAIAVWAVLAMAVLMFAATLWLGLSGVIHPASNGHLWVSVLAVFLALLVLVLVLLLLTLPPEWTDGLALL